MPWSTLPDLSTVCWVYCLFYCRVTRSAPLSFQQDRSENEIVIKRNGNALVWFFDIRKFLELVSQSICRLPGKILTFLPYAYPEGAINGKKEICKVIFNRDAAVIANKTQGPDSSNWYYYQRSARQSSFLTNLSGMVLTSSHSRLSQCSFYRSLRLAQEWSKTLTVVQYAASNIEEQLYHSALFWFRAVTPAGNIASICGGRNDASGANLPSGGTSGRKQQDKSAPPLSAKRGPSQCTLLPVNTSPFLSGMKQADRKHPPQSDL